MRQDTALLSSIAKRVRAQGEPALNRARAEVAGLARATVDTAMRMINEANQVVDDVRDAIAQIRAGKR